MRRALVIAEVVGGEEAAALVGGEAAIGDGASAYGVQGEFATVF